MPQSTTDIIEHAMPQPRNRIPKEEWRRLASVLLARKDAFTYAQIAEDMGPPMTRRMVNTRVNVLSNDHGIVSTMVKRVRRGSVETYRLTGRGDVVCRALAAGHPVPARPVEPPPLLTKSETDYYAWREKMVGKKPELV